MHTFLIQLFRNLDAIGLNLTGLTIDHIAYRASSLEEGDALKAEWGDASSKMHSAQVNGREVCVFSLKEPIVFGEFQIASCELMYPKPSKLYGGWDHIEVVLGPYSDSIYILRKRLLDRFPDIEKNAGETYFYEEDGFHAEEGRALNPNTTLCFLDKTAIRFHTTNIWEIIALEV